MAAIAATPWLPFGLPAARADTCLVAFHHAGGAASFFHVWRSHPLLRGLDVCPVELPGRGRRLMQPPSVAIHALLPDLLATIDSLAAVYSRMILFGHSLGSLMAFETALHMQAQGRCPHAVVVSARRAPQLATPPPFRHLMDDAALINELRRLGGTQEDVLASAELLELVLPAIRADFALTETYEMKGGSRLDCDLLCLRGEADREVLADDIAAWADVAAGRSEFRSYSGDHFYFNDSSVLAGVLADLRQFACLD